MSKDFKMMSNFKVKVTRGQKGHISCTRVRCANFLTDLPGQQSKIAKRPEKWKLHKGHWDLASCQVLLKSFQWFQRKSRKCLSQSDTGAAILFFRSAWKNTNLVEDVEILLPVRWIPFNGFRGEVENVLANQRSRQPYCFSDWPDKHKLGR